MGTSDQSTMAAYLDRRIEKGGHMEQIAADAKFEADRRGNRTKYDTPGAIRAHITFRLNQDKDWLKDRNLKVTEDRILKIK